MWSIDVVFRDNNKSMVCSLYSIIQILLNSVILHKINNYKNNNKN